MSHPPDDAFLLRFGDPALSVALTLGGVYSGSLQELLGALAEGQVIAEMYARDGLVTMYYAIGTRSGSPLFVFKVPRLPEALLLAQLSPEEQISRLSLEVLALP